MGASAAVVLRRRGFEVDIYERFADLRQNALNARRSINLVVARRGLRLAESLGLREGLLEQAVAVHGRAIHTLDGEEHYQAYGHGHECNYAVGRGMLNSFWLDEAEKLGARLHFSKMLQGFDLDKGTATIQRTADATGAVDKRLDYIVEKDEAAQLEQVEGIDLLLACDGGGSKSRDLLLQGKPMGYQAKFCELGLQRSDVPTCGKQGALPTLSPHLATWWALPHGIGEPRWVLHRHHLCGQRVAFSRWYASSIVRGGSDFSKHNLIRVGVPQILAGVLSRCSREAWRTSCERVHVQHSWYTRHCASRRVPPLW